MMTRCPHCGKYFGTIEIEESRLNSLYKTNNVATWAKNQLRILSEMAEDHKLPEWYVAEVKRVMNGIEITAGE